ncbi:MAG: hypothetical protein AAGA55_00970 [Planctomycetota bacterium]
MSAESAVPGSEVCVEQVYPTADELPENLLRVYFYFSKPMHPDVAHHAIKLVDQDGGVVSGAFLETEAGLWSSDRRRLSILLNPGRVKRGLDARDSMGSAIVAGNSYAFVVEAGAMALDGSRLAETYSRAFTVTEPDRQPPDPGRWIVSEPRRGTRDPLTVVLDGSVDHASLAYRVRVIEETRGVVPGRLELGEHEKRWVLIPDDPWAVGTYSLRVAPDLEDPSGNRPGRPFEQRGTSGPEPVRLIPVRIAPPPQDILHDGSTTTSGPPERQHG